MPTQGESPTCSPGTSPTTPRRCSAPPRSASTDPSQARPSTGCAVPYQGAPHDEALEKTDALYQAIEDSGCLVLEGPESKIRPEMVPGWNH